MPRPLLINLSALSTHGDSHRAGRHRAAPTLTGRAESTDARILVISDICIYRLGLRASLESIPGVHELIDIGSVAEAESVLHDLTEAIVLLDLASSGSGTLLKDGCLNAHRLGVLTLHDDPEELLGCVEAGAVAFMSRNDSETDLRDCIQAMIRGDVFYSPSVSSLFAHCAALQHARIRCRRSIDSLTARQLEIMRLVADGMSNKLIARELHVELSTVKNHMHNILRKLDVRTRGQAAALFRSGASCR